MNVVGEETQDNYIATLLRMRSCKQAFVLCDEYKYCTIMYAMPLNESVLLSLVIAKVKRSDHVRPRQALLVTPNSYVIGIIFWAAMCAGCAAD